MGWTSYYVGSKSLKDCMADEMAKFPKYNHKIKKSVQKGNNFYYLMESPKGEDWVLLMKGSKSKGEFYYKRTFSAILMKVVFLQAYLKPSSRQTMTIKRGLKNS